MFFISFVLMALQVALSHGAEFSASDLTSSFDDEFGPWDSSKLLLGDVNYGIQWRVDANQQAITILLASSTLGWLGFGIGELSSGSMLGADVVVASVDEETGLVDVTDRYVPWAAYPLTEGVTPFPVLDPQQDWTALGGHKTENGTVVVLRRQLDTQDAFDRAIDPEVSTPVIFAYGSGDNLAYHGGGRGVSSIQFGNATAETDQFVPPVDADSFLDLQMPAVTLPHNFSDAFIYYSFDLGESVLDIVAVDFDAVSPSPHFVHHLTAYICKSEQSPDWAKYKTKPRTFKIDQPPVPSCAIAFGWALGGSPIALPPDVAFRHHRFIVFQVHYNMPVNGTDSLGNPTYAGAGTTDSSGLRLHTTSKPRKFAAQTFAIHHVEPFLAIPAGEPLVHYESVCTHACTKQLARPLHIFSSFLHMHGFGKEIWTAHYDSNYNPKGIIAQTQFWNFKFQKTVFTDAITMEPGDILRLHCVFDTSKARRAVEWGEMSSQEMCINFVYYYTEDNDMDSDRFVLSQCGAMQIPFIGIDEGVSFCNNGPVIDKARLEANAVPVPCQAASNGTFPLSQVFGDDPVLSTRNSAVPGCREYYDPWLFITVVVSCVAAFVVLLAYTDFWISPLCRNAECGVDYDKLGSPVDRSKPPSNTSEASEGSDRDNQASSEFLTNPLERKARVFASKNAFPEGLILERFHKQVKADPDRLMFAWLDSNAKVVDSFTRKELWDKSRNLAYHLRHNCGLIPGQRAMIVYPFGIEFLVGFLAVVRIGVIVVSVYPPNPQNFDDDIPKFSKFVQDSGATVALTTGRYLRLVQASKSIHKNWPNAIKWVVSDKKRPAAPVNWVDHIPQPDDVALLQYTSGSTSDPKGVVITQKNIAYQTSYLERCHHIYGGSEMCDSKDIVSVGWTPAYHDMGLFGGFLSYLPSGGTAYAMSPITFLRNPIIWVEAMRRYNATCTNGPNFAFALTCKRLMALKERNGLTKMPRIPTLKFVVIGAEPSDIRLLRGIDELMGIDRSAVASMYGLAEVALAATAGSSQHVYPDLLWSVGNLEFSNAVGAVDARIVDEGTCQEVQPGEQGEIWISSPCVAAGYWGKPGISNVVFNMKLEGKGGTSESTYLRTGDLGFVRDGELFVVSRLKDLIIINGKNIAPTDVEHTAEEAFPDVIRPGSSVAIQSTPQSAVLICEVREEARIDRALELVAQKIKEKVERVVAGVELDDVILVRKGIVIKTTSGKVKRKAMKQLWEKEGIEKIFDSTDSLRNDDLRRARSLEELFCLAGVTEFELTLVENGIDSLRLVQLVEVARESFGIQIEYSSASSMSSGELLSMLSTENNEIIVRVPTAHEFSGELANQILPSRPIRIFRQSTVILVVAAVIFCSMIPSALFLKNNWKYDSDLWVQHFRSGPFVLLAFPIWIIVYSAMCIGMKWLLLRRQRNGEFIGMWSGRFSSYWTVLRLVSVWETTVGQIVSDTPFRNLFYVLLGARISLTARLHTPIRCWDLVTIGPRSNIKGQVFPRRLHFTGVFCERVRIGSDCIIGSGAVLMEGTTLSDGVKVANRALVPTKVSLDDRSGVWSGVPCALDSGGGSQNEPDPCCSYAGTLYRAAFPIFFLVAMISSTWIANEWVFAPPLSSHVIELDASVTEAAPRLVGLTIYYEHWTAKAVVLCVSYLLVHQVSGLILLFFSAVLKWSFLCPDAVDRMEPLLLRFYFPYLLKTILHQWWHLLFGIRIGKGSHVVANRMVVSPSVAHRVLIGRGSILFSMACAPTAAPDDTATHVWDWLASGFHLKSPWSSIWAKPDITIGNNCECAAGSYLESGVTLEDHSGTSTHTRVPRNTTVPSNQRIVGNPANLILPTNSKGDENQTQLSRTMANLLRVCLLLVHLGWIFCSFLLIMEVLRDLNLGDSMELEYSLPLKIGMAYVFATVSLVTELLLVKKLLFGRSRNESISVQSWRGVLFHHLQVIGQPIELLIWPLFGGLYPLCWYYKLQGANLDSGSVFIDSGGYIDPGDADNTTIRPFAVMDEGSHCVSHRVDHGMLNQGSVLLRSGATLHPGACLVLGSLGQGSQLFPLSKALREMHTGDEEYWIGLPAVLARCSPAACDNQRSASSPEDALMDV